VLSRLAAAVCLFALLGAASPRSFTNATAPYAFAFPRDHFAHDSYRTEWWYFTGHLRAADGRRFGYELTFFRIGLEPQQSHWTAGQSAWYAYQLYPAHFAITDERTGRFVYAETLARDALGQGYASESALHVGANGWMLSGTSAVRPRMKLHARDGANAIDLSLQSLKPPAVHGSGGVSKKGDCASCASHYYSFTRLQTHGTLTSAGVAYTVDGTSWMDHEFGSDELEAGVVGWDWFSIQLDDGREAMLYRMRGADGRTLAQSSGSTVDEAGSVTHVPLRGFTIVATGSWRSPATHAQYPSGWLVSIAGIAARLRLVPVTADQELASDSNPTYWEGAVNVFDAATGARVGEGYVELTGYTSALQL
jgi:predicted secreted hydrolase